MSASKASPNKNKIIIWSSVVAVVLLAVVMMASGGGETINEEAYYTVEKGNFLVTIVEGGTLEAVNEVSIRNEMKYSSKIVSVVPEGTYVKKGDLLCELDVSEIEDRLDEQKLAVESAEFAVTQAEENLKIQSSINDSNIKAAELKVEFAQTDMQKYIDGDWPQLQREAEQAILTAKEQEGIDKEDLEWKIKLHEEKYETKRNVDTARNKSLNSEIRLEQAKEAKRLLETYDYPKQKRLYEANLEEAKEELERVKQQAASRLAQYEAEVTSAKNKAELQEKKLAEYKDQIRFAKIFAPEAGMVVYPFVSFRSMSQAMIEEGATVRARQELLKLPDVSKMKVGIKVHESHVNQVVAGMPAFVVMDSLPDERFAAHVQKVSLMPDQQSRFSNPDLKVYATEIMIDDTLPDVKPGLSARAEIVITNLQSVIKVPVQCVTTFKGKQVCYTQEGGNQVPKPVEVGVYNTKFIQVVSGLSVGDKVLLSPPLNASDEGLEDTFMEDGEKVPEPTEVKAAPAQQRKGSKTEGKGGEGQAKGGFDREAMMKRFDKDGDGKLSEAERGEMRKAFQGQSGGGGSRGGAREGGAGAGRAQGGGRPQGGGGRPQGGGGRP